MLQMVSEPTLAVSRARTGQVRRIRGSVRVRCEGYGVAYGSGTWVRTHGAWVLWEGHGMVRMLLTGRAVHVCQYWTYGRGQEGTFLA